MDYKSSERLRDGTPESEAYELREPSEVDAWDVGTKCAVGRSVDSISDAYALAVDAFQEHFGRPPISDRILFRGAIMTFHCMIEIGEAPE